MIRLSAADIWPRLYKKLLPTEPLHYLGWGRLLPHALSQPVNSNPSDENLQTAPSWTRTCTSNGIHLGRVEQASPIKLTTSQIDAREVRRSCANSLDFCPVLSPLCVTEGSRSGEGLQVCLDRGCPRLQLASSSPAPRAKWCGQK